jgi:hypothetical protein
VANKHQPILNHLVQDPLQSCALTLHNLHIPPIMTSSAILDSGI